MVDWREGLSEEQIDAAAYLGKHARLLAGPGTGKSKTITHRVLALVIEHNVDPRKILVLTFTRVAAYKLKSDLKTVLEPLNKGIPFVSTLHSFALRQLLQNSKRIDILPRPLRIADDWEERWIIQEDLRIDIEPHLKEILSDIKVPIRKIQHLFNQLSADWETLKIELEESQRICCDAQFIGAWSNHRATFGYTLRAELVYQLKRALSQYPDFTLESGFEYVLVDEYQDLNACDLAVIEELSKRGCELFVAGDDDQSIYGFRYADPTGIRVFPDKYQAEKLQLTTCYRCDKSILDIGEFVASLDVYRLPKKIVAREGSEPGIVHLQCYDDQKCEARGVAEKCKDLLDKNSDTDILILLRNDRHCLISKTLADALHEIKIAVAVETDENPLESEQGRYVLSVLRLIVDASDCLALRTLLQSQCHGIGIDTQNIIRTKARNSGVRYSEILSAVKEGPYKMARGDMIKQTLKETEAIISQCKPVEKPIEELVKDIVAKTVPDSDQQQLINDYLASIMVEASPNTISELLSIINSSIGFAEQELVQGKVNIMTMHKAKGLSADVVFVVGAEKQYIPGKNIGAKAEDERRLLYVSLTRARHELIITYCRERTGQQRYTGSESGKSARELTPFLRNAPLKVEHVAF
jgi:DNA helicase-2/ATP-dependent DNA helicase PcrA